jgi:hypothetical protein
MLALIGFISKHVLLARFRDHETVMSQVWHAWRMRPS